jgi:hypothetical protein
MIVKVVQDYIRNKDKVSLKIANEWFDSLCRVYGEEFVIAEYKKQTDT